MKLLYLLYAIGVLSLVSIRCANDQVYVTEEANILKTVYENPNISNYKIYILIEPIIDRQVDSNLQYFNNAPKDDIKLLLGAMILLESGRLTSTLSYQNNILGIKCLSARPCITLPTYEEVNGNMQLINSKFAVFYSFEDCIHNWFTLLRQEKTSNGNYRYNIFMNSENVAEMCIQISMCGYATDSKYTQKLWNIVNSIKNDTLYLIK